MLDGPDLDFKLVVQTAATRGHCLPWLPSHCSPAVTLGTLCSFGGPSVLKGCQRGRGLAARTGAILVQPRNRPECGRGGEAHQTPRGFWKVCSNLGREVLCPREADDGKWLLDAEVLACWFSGAASSSCSPPRPENPCYYSVFKNSKDLPEIGDFLGMGPGETIWAATPQAFPGHLGWWSLLIASCLGIDRLGFAFLFWSVFPPVSHRSFDFLGAYPYNFLQNFRIRIPSTIAWS